MSTKNIYTYTVKTVVNSLGMQQIVNNNLHKSGPEYVQAFLDLATRPADLMILCTAIFEDFPQDINPETDIDISLVQEGVQSFLLKVLFGSRKLPSTEKG
jgi:hypothetical protein